MKKFYCNVAGMNMLCDQKGILLKDTDGNVVPVSDEDAANEETHEKVETPEGDNEELQKMLAEAGEQAKAMADKNLGDTQVKVSNAIAKLFESITSAATKSTRVFDNGGAVQASFNVEEVEKGLKALSERKRNSFSFEIRSTKDLDFLVKTTSQSGSLTGDVIEGQRDPELTRDPVRTVFIESIANVVSNMTSEHLSWVEVVSESGAPLPTAELALIPQKDFEFQEFKAPLKKIAVINKHSVELLQDAPQLVNAIKTWLVEDVNIVVDQQLLNGDGINQNLEGVFGKASVLNQAAVGAKRVEFANLYDVIRVALTKIAVVGKGKFNGNYVLLNPDDADALDLTKDENGQYLLPPFRSADGTMIKGARIIENVGVPAGKFLVGDFTKLHIGTKGGAEIEMTNSDGTDFSHDILSVKIRRRMASYVRQNDDGAFWTGDIEDVIGWLTAS